MKEKYRGKIKVPFCVKREPNKTSAILSEILGFAVFTNGSFEYYGINENGKYDCWDTPRLFGENTTIYTLEELKAIVDEVNKAEKVLMEGGDRFRIKDSLDGGTWYRPNEWYTFHSYFTDDTVVTQEDVDDGMTYGSIYILDKDIDYTSIVKQKTTASCSDDTATLTEDEYVDVGEDETVSNERVEGNTIIKANLSFDVTIKGQTFNLTPEELQDLYLQLCVAEGTLQDWRLGQ